MAWDDYGYKSLKLPMVDEIWKHYKGGTFIVVCVGRDGSYDTPVVVYVSADSETVLFTQSLSRFLELVEVEGEHPGMLIKTPRFSFVASAQRAGLFKGE